MAKISALDVWSLDYRLLMVVITSVAPDVAALGVEIKALFVLAEIDEHPHPAALAVRLSMPKASVTVNVKRLEALGLVRRQIDAGDLRRHRLLVTAAGRKIMARGLGLLSEAFSTHLSRLSANEQAELKRLLEKMIQ